MNKDLGIHIVQSETWGVFKARVGTTPIKVGDIQYTKHKIPFINKYVAYAPKVNFNVQKFSWKELTRSLQQESCIAIRFDVPNVIDTQTDKKEHIRLIEELNSKCKKSPRSTFAKCNVLLDIGLPEKDIVAKFSQKTRYNSKLAARKGVEIKIENNEKGLKIFNRLLKETAKRQGFSLHPESYYEKVFDTLYANKKANILIAYYKSTPLVSWMLFNHDNALYYAYGGSSNEHRNLMASNLIAWEAIKLGKKLDCSLFDMWGATDNKDHSYWGFTKFKLGYGGELVKYISSYDYIVDNPIYYIFNLTYSIYWKVIEPLRRKFKN